MPEVAHHTDELDGQPVFWRSAGWAPGDATAPVVYVHGVPTNSDDWVPFLERGGGIAPDLPGFGRSGKRGDGDFTMTGYGAWLGRFLDHLGVDRFRLMVHDWGGAALITAQDRADRVERLVVCNAAPLLPGYHWHWIARIWRRRPLGEAFMGMTTRPGMRLLSRQVNAAPGPMPEAWVASVMDHFDQGTQRAILRLYRSAPEEALARAGEHLGDLTCPALVLWGDRDPYIAPHFADDFAAALGGETVVEHVADAGHYPWIDRPELVDRAVAFLTAP